MLYQISIGEYNLFIYVNPAATYGSCSDKFKGRGLYTEQLCDGDGRRYGYTAWRRRVQLLVVTELASNTLQYSLPCH